MADHLGMRLTDLQCLGPLSLEPEPLSTGEIAKLTGLTLGSATRLVDTAFGDILRSYTGQELPS